LPEMTSPQGTPVAAVYGFTRDLLDIIEKKKPDYLFCALDAPGPTFRHERFEAYKANRAEMPADLVPQIPLVRQLLDVMGIPCLEMAGYEADDILATIARQVESRGGECVLATSDKDARQLLSGRVRLLNLRTNAFMGPEELRAEWGIGPEQVVDYLTLVGDSADNVPGVPLIGPKIASELLQAHGSLDHVLAHPDVVAGKKRQENVRTYADAARASRELVRLDEAVPVAVPWEQGRLHAPDAERLAGFLKDLGFQSLVTKARKSGATARPAPPAQRTMFDLGAEPDAAAVPVAVPQVTTVSDDAALATLVPRLRGAGPVAICVAVGEGSTLLAPPAGLALATADAAAWIAPEVLAARDRPGMQLLAELLGDPAVPKVGHDLKRQAVSLRVAGCDLAGGRFDTLLAAYLLDAGERNHGLAEVARRHGIDVALDDDAALERPADAARAAEACGIVHMLSDRLAAALEADGLAILFADVELPLAAVLAGMEFRGVRIDVGTLAALSKDYAARLAALEAEIHALAGHAFSIASPLQVRAVLFDELGLPVVYSGPARQVPGRGVRRGLWLRRGSRRTEGRRMAGGTTSGGVAQLVRA
ncbi:MAG: 5'-3' exonuclease H3TH domain-containing protein, partial [Planctomycetia bacterium]